MSIMSRVESSHAYLYIIDIDGIYRKGSSTRSHDSGNCNGNVFHVEVVVLSTILLRLIEVRVRMM